MPPASKPSSGKQNARSSSEFKEKPPDSDIRSFTLRVHGGVIDQVDEAVSAHPVIRNRNTWIANAIVEQLKRERQG